MGWEEEGEDIELSVRGGVGGSGRGRGRRFAGLGAGTGLGIFVGGDMDVDVGWKGNSGGERRFSVIGRDVDVDVKMQGVVVRDLFYPPVSARRRNQTQTQIHRRKGRRKDPSKPLPPSKHK